jgi:UDP-glucose/iron transport system ATP-binding protein
LENTIIETRDLSFSDLIHYQDIKIERSKVHFIVGKSGTGKSTLLRLFNVTLSPSKGNIFYDGKDIADIDTTKLRKEILLISQSLYLFDGTIKDNFKKYYEFREEDAPSEEEMEKFLHMCCIDFPLDKSCTLMSGGERQRVYIAIFLSFYPKILMLDEPTSALDTENSHNVIKNILEYCKMHNITVIIVSHDSSIVEEFAENIIKIEKRKE